MINAKLNGTEAVEDVYQETILSAWLNRNTLKDKSLFKSWLFQIARNKCNDYFRKAYKTVEKSYEELDVEIAVNRFGRKGASSDLQRENVKAAVTELKPEDKEIIEMFYYKGLTLAQIAQNKSIPLATVKRRLFDARNRLKKQVKERSNSNEY